MKSILDHSQATDDKVLLFSRSLMTLDYIEEWLTRWTDRSSSCRWIKGHDYFRLDGKQRFLSFSLSELIERRKRFVQVKPR